MKIEELLEQLRQLPTYGYSNHMKRAIKGVIWRLEHLENFVRTPEWSVSMLEDIAALFQTDLPDLEEDDPFAWKGH